VAEQLRIEAFAEFFVEPAYQWKPRPWMLAKVKSYFEGYTANRRDIYARRKHIAEKLGVSIRTLARYLAWLAADGWIETIKRTARTAIRKVLSVHSVSSISVPSSVPPIEVKPPGTNVLRRFFPSQHFFPTTGYLPRQHHPEMTLPEADPIKKAAGIERLSEGDRVYVRNLKRSGLSLEVIRAGVLLGRARRIMHEARVKTGEKIRSLRYFAGAIEEASADAEKVSSGYVQYLERWIEKNKGAAA
jgi:hypothetical protein